MKIPDLIKNAVSGNESNGTGTLPHFNLGENLYHSKVIQGAAYRPIDLANVFFHVIGGILGLFSTPYSIIGTILYALGVVPMMLLWVVAVPLRFLARKSAVNKSDDGENGGENAGGEETPGTIGYSIFWSGFSVLWYLGFWFAAFVTFSASASKTFKDGSGEKATGFVFALIQWMCVSGTLRSSMLVFQSGFTLSKKRFCLPDLVLEIGGSGAWSFVSDVTSIGWKEVETLVTAISKEDFKTVKQHTSGNVTTTTTRTWSRNVLWIAFRDGSGNAYGFPVSACGDQSCSGYCCNTIERWQERGVLPSNAKAFLDTFATERPDLATQVNAIKELIDSTVKI